MLWSIAVDLPPARKAALVILNLRGQAQRLAMSIPPQALVNGGLINGAQVDALTFLMHSLSERYAPLGEESRLKAMTEIFNFQRLSGESVDDLLTRFDITRQVAADEGGVGLNVQALSWFLLKACRPSDDQLLRLLSPFQGRYPQNDAEFRQLQDGIRRMGHILEGHTGNIAAALRQGPAAPNMFFGTDASGQSSDGAAADPWHFGQAQDPWSQGAAINAPPAAP